jgi:hypothetical protein
MQSNQALDRSNNKRPEKQFGFSDFSIKSQVNENAISILCLIYFLSLKLYLFP